MLDPFPNELVEAVEEACTIIENRCGTVRGIGPAMREALAAVLPLIEQRVKDQLREGSVEKSDPTDAEKMRAAYDAGAADAEQRVIDRLAREADDDAVHISSLADPRIALCGGQKKRSMADFASPSPDKWEGCWTCLAEKRAIDERVACGVAAERARCPLCNHEWRRHDPEDGRCDCHSETIIGPCQCGRDIVWMQERIAAMSLAALAPERTGEGT